MISSFVLALPLIIVSIPVAAAEADDREVAYIEMEKPVPLTASPCSAPSIIMSSSQHHHTSIIMSRSQTPDPRSQIPHLLSQLPDPRSQLPDLISQLPDPRSYTPALHGLGNGSGSVFGLQTGVHFRAHPHHHGAILGLIYRRRRRSRNPLPEHRSNPTSPAHVPRMT